ncbi:MAG: T9SS type A sorting domain-containing protein [Flavobacteriales bacterium]|nr:T9SS type A sorting domain-containing protein [Flavobacteriales bacterium]
MKKNTKSRRQFLKNFAIAGAVGLSPMARAFSVSKLSSRIPDPTCNPTTLDLYGQGPFYTPNAPTILNGALASANEPGTKLIISGTVYNLDCSQVLPNTIIDIWHADDSGAYDNNGFNLRGVTQSNNQGHYIFETIKPGLYLNGNNFRPSHIHFKISPPGFPTLTTQVYFQGDPHISSDLAASDTSTTYDATHRIIPLNANANGDLEGTWDIVVDGNGTVGLEEFSDKGVIYELGPNPVTHRLNIFYGVFEKSQVSITIFDIHGRMVAQLSDEKMINNKYEAIWKPDPSLENGHYFVVMKVNDTQVQTKKVILKR